MMIGEVVMAQRRYNAKRVVWEPFLVKNEIAHSNYLGKRVLFGQWQLDGTREGHVLGNVKPLDVKWVVKKIAELEKEEEILHHQRLNLNRLLVG